MNNLIYIVYDRGFRTATYDFKEAINAAFSDSHLAIYDLNNKETLLDFYCDENTLCELESELIERELIDLIPDFKTIYNDLKNKYEEIWNRSKAINQKTRDEYDYQIYLRVKERLENSREE